MDKCVMECVHMLEKTVKDKCKYNYIPYMSTYMYYNIIHYLCNTNDFPIILCIIVM